MQAKWWSTVEIWEQLFRMAPCMLWITHIFELHASPSEKGGSSSRFASWDGVKEIVNRPPNQDDAAKIKYHLLIDASLNRMWSGVQVVRSVPTLRTGGPFRERLSGGDERSLDQRSQDPRAFAHGKSRRRLCKRIRRMKPAGKGTRGNNYCSKYRGHLGFGFYLAARMSDYDLANSEQPQSYAPHYVWQYFAVTNDADAKKGGAAARLLMLSAYFVIKASCMQHF